MLSRFPLWVLRVLTGFLLVCVPASLLNAQTYIPTQEELEQLLAPIALYPDALLAQIMTASTNPQEILDVDSWLRQNSGLSGAALTNAAQAQGFDPAFIALVTFPQVLDMMAQNIDDYAAIGAAFEANQDSVMESVQNLRQIAYDSGALRNTPQQQVLVEPYNGQQIIVIQPANPDVVYLPQYDPRLIYGGTVGYGVPMITFGAGIGLGVLLGNTYPWGWGGWGWNWGQRSLLYNRMIWRPQYNRYRPPRRTYRPRRPNYQNRPRIQPVRPRPGRPSQERPTSARPGRPNTGRPTSSRPGGPSTRPARPAQPTRPTNGVRPAPVPSRPRRGQTAVRPAPQRPQNQPAPQRRQNRPRPQGEQTRPAPQPRPQQQDRPQQQARPQQQNRQAPQARRTQPAPQQNNR